MAKEMMHQMIEKFTLKPLAPQYFVGRHEQVNKILYNGLISPTPNLLDLQGPQKIGRTSLLHFLQFLAKGDGAGTDYDGLFKKSAIEHKLVCPYIDLRLLMGSSREEINAHFIRILTSSLNEFAVAEATESTLFHLMQAIAEKSEHRYLLFIDRAEYLLDQVIQENIKDTLGVLNDSLPNLGILLSFGASGDLSAQDSIHRAAEIDKSIASISSLMNLVREDIEVGLLEPEEALHFLESPTSDDSKTSSSFSKEELDWISELAGTHPYLLNLVGLLVWKQKWEQGISSLTRLELSQVEENAAHQLKSLINSIWRRLSDLKDRRVAELVYALISSPAHSVMTESISEDLTNVLKGEGLIQRTDAHWVMPSRLLRQLLLAQLEHDGKFSLDFSGMQAPINILVVEEDGASHEINLTELEAKIMGMLLKAGPNQLVTTNDLLEGVWGIPLTGNDQQKLSQRLRVLRNKLKASLHKNPIENVYGEGYRLVKPERFKLQLT